MFLRWNLRIAVEQPYLFPYLGYWQLINCVDEFVVLDNVQFIKRGFINRNSVLINGEAKRFSVPLEGASQNKLISDIRLLFSDKDKLKFLRTIQLAYKKAPCFDTFYPCVEEIINNPETRLVEYIINSIHGVLDYLGIKKKIIRSSVINLDNNLDRQDRIISICNYLNAKEYINPCGGRELYDYNYFLNNNISLFFIDTRWDKVIYQQYDNLFIPKLSIIDVLMFNDPTVVRKQLLEYDLNRI